MAQKLETLSSLKATHQAYRIATQVAYPRMPALEEVIPKQPSAAHCHLRGVSESGKCASRHRPFEEPRELVYYEVVPDAAWKASERRVTIFVLTLFVIFLGIMCYIAREALFRG